MRLDGHPVSRARPRELFWGDQMLTNMLTKMHTNRQAQETGELGNPNKNTGSACIIRCATRKNWLRPNGKQAWCAAAND